LRCTDAGFSKSVNTRKAEVGAAVAVWHDPGQQEEPWPLDVGLRVKGCAEVGPGDQGRTFKFLLQGGEIQSVQSMDETSIRMVGLARTSSGFSFGSDINGAGAEIDDRSRQRADQRNDHPTAPGQVGARRGLFIQRNQRYVIKLVAVAAVHGIHTIVHGHQVDDIPAFCEHNQGLSEQLAIDYRRADLAETGAIDIGLVQDCFGRVQPVARNVVAGGQHVGLCAEQDGCENQERKPRTIGRGDRGCHLSSRKSMGHTSEHRRTTSTTGRNSC